MKQSSENWIDAGLRFTSVTLIHHKRNIPQEFHFCLFPSGGRSQGVLCSCCLDNRLSSPRKPKQGRLPSCWALNTRVQLQQTVSGLVWHLTLKQRSSEANQPQIAPHPERQWDAACGHADKTGNSSDWLPSPFHSTLLNGIQGHWSKNHPVWTSQPHASTASSLSLRRLPRRIISFLSSLKAVYLVQSSMTDCHSSLWRGSHASTALALKPRELVSKHLQYKHK